MIFAVAAANEEVIFRGKVIVAMYTDRGPGNGGYIFDYTFDQPAEFRWYCVTDGVGDIYGRGPRLLSLLS